MHSLDQLEFELSFLQNIHIIHAASPASFSSISKDVASIIESNVLLTERLTSILERNGGKITFFSSGEVYGTSPKLPTKESDYAGFDHLLPFGIYPEVKKFAELKLRIWHEKTGIPVSILRIFHTFGPGIVESDTRVFSSVIYDLVNNRDIALNSSGEAQRSFLYTSDLAKAINILEPQAGFEVFNVAGDQEISILEFARLVSSHNTMSKVTFPSQSTEVSSIQNPIMRGLADTTKLKNLGWKPTTSMEQAITNTIESLMWRQSMKYN